MAIQESIVHFTCLYLALAYAIFYLYFQAYPIIFEGTVLFYLSFLWTVTDQSSSMQVYMA